MPALAVAEALRERGAEVSFIGVRGTSAAGMATAAGYQEDELRLRGLPRRPTPSGLWALALALAAVPRAIAILARRRADVVIGAGGYVAGPVALAARLTRRPVLLMEADSHLGVANRLAAPMAARVTLAFPLPGRVGPRYLVTGRPVSRAVLNATRTAGRRQFGIPAAEAFRRMTTPARTEQDLSDVARYVALLLLREIPRAVLAGRRHLIAPLLGECIRLTTGEHSNHPAIRLLKAPVGAAM